MTLRKKQILSLAIVVVGIALMVGGRYTELLSDSVAIVGFVVTVIGFIVYDRLACCPHCHKPLQNERHCKNCGRSINR